MNLFSSGFLASFCNFNLKSYVNRLETVKLLTLTPFANNGDCFFLIELVGDQTTILFIK